MRLRVLLTSKRLDPAIPINYQYPLASAIYRILSSVETAYATFLHQQGYSDERGKRMKLFCFSRIMSERKPVVEGRVLRWFGRPRLWFHIGSPMEETFVRNTLVGMLSGQGIDIGSSDAAAGFVIEEVTTIDPPKWTNQVRGIALAPITTSVQEDGRRTATYLHPLDARFAEGVRANILAKHALLSGSRDDELDFHIVPDAAYIQERGDRAISKLVTIKQGRESETRVKGFVFPFILSGNPILLHTAWECGLGEKNSIGFGMWDARVENESGTSVAIHDM